MSAVDGLFAELKHESIGDVLNVLRHLIGIHADELAWQSLGDEVALDLACRLYNLVNVLRWALFSEVFVERHGKLLMQTLIAAYQFVRKRKARHKTPLLEPKDGTKRPAEEDALDAREGDETLGKRCIGSDPRLGPGRLVPNAWDSIYGLKQSLLLHGVYDELVNHK